MGTTGTRRNAAFLIVAYSTLAAVLLWLLARSIAEGGNPWQQGDWLINYGAGFVRRGLSGQLILGRQTVWASMR